MAKNKSCTPKDIPKNLKVFPTLFPKKSGGKNLFSVGVVHKSMKTFQEWLMEMAAPTARPVRRQILNFAKRGTPLRRIATLTGKNIDTVKSILQQYQAYDTSKTTHSQLPPPEVVNQILQGHDEGYSDEDLAAQFHLTPTAIRRIIVTAQPSRSPAVVQRDEEGNVLPAPKQPKYNTFGKKYLGDKKHAMIYQLATQPPYLNDLEIMRKLGVGRSTVRRALMGRIDPYTKQKRDQHNLEVMSKFGKIGAGRRFGSDSV